MAFSVSVASDLATFALDNFLKGKDPKSILKHLQKRPLLRALADNKKEYGSGKTNFSEPVKGALMADTSGFYVGISGDDVLTFTASDGGVLTQFPFKWMHAGWKISHDELLSDGIHIVEGKVKSSAEEKTQIASVYETKLADFGESYAIQQNLMLWGDGSSDAKSIPGIKSIITDDPTTGVTGGINRSNLWWRHIARTGVGGALPKVQYSKQDQTLTETLAKDARQLTRFGGNPDVWFAGSDFLDAAEKELRAKGTYTMNGWQDKKTGILVKGLMIGQNAVEYDPTLDNMGESKRCYAWDSTHLILRPMKMEWGKVTDQNQPSDQFVFLKSITDRGTLSCNQMDCNGVWEVA